MDFLGSSLWGGIGVLVAIVFGIIAIILTFVQMNKARNRKMLLYGIISNAPVVTVNKDVKSRVKILLDNNPIEDARLVVVKVLNGGDVPIETVDYENGSGIVFDLGTGAEVLNIDLLGKNPKSLKPSLSFRSENVLLEPLLLNSQDSFSFKVLITGFKGNIRVEGRISGVKEIMTFVALPRNVRRRTLDRLVAIGTLIGVFGSYILAIFIRLAYGSIFYALIAFMSPFMFMVLFSLYSALTKKKALTVS